jgi:hypothetical protein
MYTKDNLLQKPSKQRFASLAAFWGGNNLDNLLSPTIERIYGQILIYWILLVKVYFIKKPRFPKKTGLCALEKTRTRKISDLLGRNFNGFDYFYCQAGRLNATPTGFQLYDTLSQHRVGDFEEPGDIGADNIVTRLAILGRGFRARLVDTYHDVVQSLVDFLTSPAQT